MHPYTATTRTKTKENRLCWLKYDYRPFKASAVYSHQHTDGVGRCRRRCSRRNIDFLAPLPLSLCSTNKEEETDAARSTVGSRLHPNPLAAPRLLHSLYTTITTTLCIR